MNAKFVGKKGFNRGSSEILTGLAGLISLDFFSSRGRTKFFARQIAKWDITKGYYLTLMKIIFNNKVHVLTTSGYFEIVLLLQFEYLNIFRERKSSCSKIEFLKFCKIQSNLIY